MIDLDKRILDGKKPLTAFDELDSKYIGTDCFFSDKPSDFADLSKCQVGKLMSLDAVSGMFGASKNNSYAVFYFCLPCEWVKKEPKYRPFSIEDWKFKHSFGDTILYRRKGTYCGWHREAETMYLGYVKQLNGITDEAGKGELILGDGCYDIQNLFDNYEIWIDGGWQPFGFEVRDGE